MLTNAVSDAASSQSDLSQSDLSQPDASKADDEVENNQASGGGRRSVIIALALLSLVFAVIAAAFWRNSVANEREAISQRLTAEALAARADSQPGLASVLALEAMHYSDDPTFVQVQALSDSLSDYEDRAFEAVGFEGHDGYVRDVTFSPDGRLVASSGDSGPARLWDAATGQQLLVLEDPGPIWGVAFSPDGESLATGGGMGQLDLWDVESGERLAAFEGHGAMVRSVEFSSDGDFLVTSGSDFAVRVWDVRSTEEVTVVRVRPDPDSNLEDVWPFDAAFSPDGDSLAVARTDGSVRVWDAATGDELLVLEGHTGQAESVDFSPDGQLIASAGDQTVRLWDAASGEELMVLDGHAGRVLDVAFSSDGERLVSAGADGSVRVWDALSGKSLAVLGGHSNEVWAVAISPDGERLASVGEDDFVLLWDPPQDEQSENHASRIFGFTYDDKGVRVQFPSERLVDELLPTTQWLCESIEPSFAGNSIDEYLPAGSDSRACPNLS